MSSKKSLRGGPPPKPPRLPKNSRPRAVVKNLDTKLKDLEKRIINLENQIKEINEKAKIIAVGTCNGEYSPEAINMILSTIADNEGGGEEAPEISLEHNIIIEKELGDQELYATTVYPQSYPMQYSNYFNVVISTKPLGGVQELVNTDAISKAILEYVDPKIKEEVLEEYKDETITETQTDDSLKDDSELL